MSWPFGPAPPEGASPPVHLGFALAEDLADQGLEGLGQGGVGDVALVLVELARREQPARRDQHLVQLVDDRRLADAGIAGDQHELRCAIGHDPVEGREQRVDLALAAVQSLRESAAGPTHRACQAETVRCGRAPPIPPSSAADQLARPAAVW